MATKQQQAKQKWYQYRKGSAIVIVLSLIGCYIMASLAINSASLLQYFVAIVLLGLAINRAAHIVIISITGHPDNG
jgi:hypothetical protein